MIDTALFNRKGTTLSKVAALLLAGGSILFSGPAQADPAMTNTYTTGGPGTWTCPAGVNLVQVEVWGGGGAGGGGLKETGAKNGCGGGGGGGAYARFNAYSVSPTTDYAFNVGTNGVGVRTNTGTAGGDSWFVSSGTLDALGGGGGGAGIGVSSGAFGPSNGQGAAGIGAAAGTTGDVHFAGGNGAIAPGTSGGGGGGGSGGFASNGNNASGSPGAAAVTGGGVGGYANTTSGNGTNGFVPGGGGGGAKSGVVNETDTGGNGASGQVQFMYYITPTIQASAVSFSAVDSASMTISWTPGNGNNSLVLVRAGSAVNASPVNGTIYSDNLAFGTGSQVGSGNFVVYQGPNNSATITGLAIGTTYYVAVYSFNGLASPLVEYLSTSPATGSQATVSAPTVDMPTKSAIVVSTATLGATVENNNGGTISSYGVVWSTSADPDIVTGNTVVKGTSLSSFPTAFSVNVSGLPAGTVVHYRGYATSAAGTGYSLDDSFVTQANPPTVQASSASFSSSQGGAANLSWTRGNGATCIVLAKAGSAVDSVPVDGTTYTPDADFGSGTEIGSGNYVVYLGSGTNVTMSALTPGSTYYVAVYELNGSGGSENYLTTSPATAGGATAVTHPVIYYSGAATGDPTSTGSWWTGTNGTGANPADFTEGDTFIIQAGNNYTLAAGNTWAVNATTAGTAATVEVETNGTLTFDLSTSGASPVLQLGGNLIQSVTGGLAGSFNSSVAQVEFTSSGTWTGSGDVSGLRLSVSVDAGATLDASGLTSRFLFKASNAHGLTVNTNAVLNLGALQVSGANSSGLAFFKLLDGGTLITAYTGAQGVPGVFLNFNANKVTLSSNANYILNGTAAQYTGTSTAAATMPSAVNNLVISNSAGVTLSQSTTVNGLLTVAANSLLDMNGNTLTVAGSALSSSSTLMMEFTRNSSTTFSGSQFTQTAGTLQFAGTLQVVGSGSFAGGDQFQLFSAPAYSGNFTSVGGTPGSGLAYSFDSNTGLLRVVSLAPPPASIMTSVNGNSLVLTWPVNQGWRLQVQTNSIATGLSTNWTDVPGATSPFTTNTSSGSDCVFYRLTYP